MIVTAREFTSAAEMRAAAVAAHNRCFKPKVRPVLALPAPPPIETPKPIVQVFTFRPEWKCRDTHFDSHVIESRRIIEMIKAGEIELVNLRTKTVSQIVAEVLVDFPKVTVGQVKGVGRRREIVAARQMAMWQVRQQRPDMSFPAIGRWFGGRDHTTVLHAVRKIEAMRGEA